MCGVRNLRRPTPKYPIFWDVNVLLLYISSWSVSSLDDISFKLATLLAILSVHTLSLIDFRGILFSTSGTFLSIYEDLKVVRSRPKFVISLPGSLGLDPLGVVSLLKLYCSLTKPLRAETCFQLFISYCKPHRGVSPDTLARWVRFVMSKAGIDTAVFGSHSIRGSAASQANISLDSVLAAGDWSTTQSFSRHHDRPAGNLPSPTVANVLMRSFRSS